MPPHRLLVIENEHNLSTYYTEVLRRAGYDVRLAQSGAEGLREFRDSHPGLVLLDLYLDSEPDGFQVLETVRQMDSDCGLIIITSSQRDDHVVRTLNLGADNYVVKPVSREQLLARVRAQLRLLRDPGREVSAGCYSFGSLIVDLERSQLRRADGGSVLARQLSDIERHLFALLLRRAGQLVSYREIARVVWRQEFRDDASAFQLRPMAAALYRLRRKIAQLQVAGAHDFVDVVRDQGWILTPPDADQAERHGL
jgi:DNA-binding response OmpR family regulator